MKTEIKWPNGGWSKFWPTLPFTVRTFGAIFLALVLLFVTACGGGGGGSSGVPDTACLNSSDPTPEPDASNQSNARVDIINNDATLDTMVNCSNSIVPIGGSGGGLNAGFSTPPSLPQAAGKNFKLRLRSEVPPPKIVGVAVWNNLGNNDITAGGTYTGTQQVPPFIRYTVQIDSVGGTDTFRWSIDGGSTWVQQNVLITGAAQALNNGVNVTFAGTTGHAGTEQWFIDAGILQATSVSISGNLGVVSFAMAGVPYLGAIQVYRLRNRTARLKSQAVFRDMDVLAAHISGGFVYAAGAHNPVVRPSAVERLILTGSNLGLDTGTVELSSFAATSILHDPTRTQVYVTDGDDNGLVVLTETLGTPTSFPLEDARWVALEGNSLAVAQGCCGPSFPPPDSGEVTLYDVSGGTPASPNPWTFTGADINDSKTTVQLLGGKAFIGAGSGGALVVNPANGAVLASIANPTGPGIPLPPLNVANAVSADEDLLFISNGEAGVYVAQENGGDFISTGLTANLTLLGQLQFASLQSVNHVAYLGRYLVVAAGLGGVKIVRINVP